MKSTKPILIAFFLLISLPFVSKAQKGDSASFQKPSESKLDSTTIRNSSRSGRKFYLSNGAVITKYELTKRLSIFNSSSSELKKSNAWKIRRRFFLGGIGAGALMFNIYEIGFSSQPPRWSTAQMNYYNQVQKRNLIISVSLLAVSVPLTVFATIAKKEHLKKAIRLYNEEIIKRHK